MKNLTNYNDFLIKLIYFISMGQFGWDVFDGLNEMGFFPFTQWNIQIIQYSNISYILCSNDH